MFTGLRRSVLLAATIGTMLGAQTVTDTLALTGTAGTLSQYPVVPGSWQVFDLTGAVIDSAKFRVEPISGLIQWLADGAEVDSIIVKYQALPMLNPERYDQAWFYLPKLADLPADTTRVEDDRLRIKEQSERLVTAGSLYRGVTTSSAMGGSLTGGLNLRLQGEISPGVFINGHFTDVDLPIQPEGDTRTLNELDEVRLSISAANGEMAVGDFVLRSSGGPLAQFDRKLEGMNVRYSHNNWRGEGAVAGTKGRYRSQNIAGVDGNQGPYALTTDEGARLLIILAGTEKVWLNGIAMQRGEGSDYTIDYNTAEVTFTPRHTIRSDSRIVVDFEYTDLVYNRTTTYLSSAWRWERSNFQVVVFSERDNMASNLEFSLDAGDRAWLAAAGDSLISQGHATATADSNGAYVLVGTHYEYVGAGAGTHAVTFHNIGSAGAYRREVTGDRVIYIYVPPEDRTRYQAVYSPVRYLKAPRTDDFMAVNWELTNETGLNRLQVNLAASEVDLNRFSVLDDDDNRAFGYALAGNWQSNPIAIHDREYRVHFQGTGRGKGSGFQAPGRWDAVELIRDWDLRKLPEDYDWQTGRLGITTGENGGAYLETGRLSSSDLTTVRYQYGVKGSALNRAEYHYDGRMLDRKNTSRQWRLGNGEIKYHFNKWGPFVRYYHEDRTDVAGDSLIVRETAVGATLKLAGEMTVGLSREQRYELWSGAREENGQIWRVAMSGKPRRGTRIETSVAFNKKSFSDSRVDIDYLMGDVTLVNRVPGSAGWFDFRYRAERTVSETKSIIYREVGPGRGQYRYDEAYDSYVLDPAGTFIRILLPSGRLQPVNAIRSRLKSQIDLTGLGSLLQDYQEARLGFQGRIESQHQRHTIDTYLLPDLGDTSAVAYLSTARINWTLRKSRKTPRYRLQTAITRQFSRNQRGGSEAVDLPGERREKKNVELNRISRREMEGFDTNLELIVRLETDEAQSQVNPLRNYEISRKMAQGGFSVSITERFTPNLRVRWQEEHNRTLDNLKVTVQVFTLGAQQALGRQGRLRLEADWYHVTASADRALPMVMAEGFPVGNSRLIRGSGQFPLSKSVLLTASVYSRNEPGRQPVTTANLEVRTQF